MADLQGAWRLDTQTLRGGQVHTQQTHLVVDGDSWREVWDRKMYSDQPRPTTTFRRDDDLLHMATHWHQPDGTVQGPFTATWRFEIDGDTLRVCNAGNDLIPESVDDQEGVVATFTRVVDPDEVVRVSAAQEFHDKPVRHHETLGELRWDDNLDWWKSTDGLIGLSIPADAPLQAYADRALLLQQNMSDIMSFAASRLLDLHNDTWREEPGKETRAGFVGKLTLDGITLYEDFSAEVYFADGGLFWGHIVLVSVDKTGTPTGADIAG